MSEHLQIECCQTPITALQSWANLIIAGQGPFLKIYERESTDFIYSAQIFERQAIHGVRKSQEKNDRELSLLIWGGRDLCYHRLIRTAHGDRNESIQIHVCDKISVLSHTADWIFDVAFRPGTGPDIIRDVENLSLEKSAVLVTAHNEVYEIKIDEQATDTCLLKVHHLFSGPRCGLYSATLKWLNPTQVLIGSGTAFGEIVLWSLSLASGGLHAQRHFIFTGHEGSIFGVQISDDLTLRNGQQIRLLASCSDDRTIRLWDISDLTHGTTLSAIGLANECDGATRTTGFLNYVSEEVQASSKNLCIASSMGHVSRIWDVRFAIERQASSTTNYVASIISAGEDATCQKWHLFAPIEPPLDFSLKHICTEDNHAGKNIWSLLVTKAAVSPPAIYSGGADGRIIEHDSILNHSSGEKQRHLEIDSWDIEDIRSNLITFEGSQDLDAVLHSPSTKGNPGSGKTKCKADCVRSLAFFKNQQILLTTNDGLVVLASLMSKSKEWSWKLLGIFDSLRGYSISCRLASGRSEYVFLGDTSGNIYFCHSLSEQVELLVRVEGKITGLMGEVLPPRSIESLSVVVTRQGALPPIQLRIDLGTDGRLILAEQRVLAPRDGSFPKITCCTVATKTFKEVGLIVGCRNGSIHSYSTDDSETMTEFDSDIPLAHDKEAVTCMVWMADMTYDGTNRSILGRLFSVGRDGMLAVHEFRKQAKYPTLIHRLALSFGPTIESLHVDSTTSDVIVSGFTSKFFVYQNLSSLKDIATIECGGAHRIWTFGPLSAAPDGTTQGIFAWTKTSKLNIARISVPSHKVIQAGGHGREIKACAIAPCEIKSEAGPLVATGAEDTDIYLHSYAKRSRQNQSGLKQVCVLRKHITGVQALQWSSNGRYLFSSGGCEEFFVWHVTPMPSLTIGVVCESICPVEKSDSELRLTDFAVRDVSSQAGDDGDLVDCEFIISMVYSDSTIKVWKYTYSRESEERPAWSLLFSGQYTAACLTAVAYLTPAIDGWPIVTGSTDGRLAFWLPIETTRSLACHCIQPLHQGSIKALSSVLIGVNQWLILTGGDDNALGITTLQSNDDAVRSTKFTSSSLLVANAHAAAISAVNVLRWKVDSERDLHTNFRVITAGSDQMIKLWNVTSDPQKAPHEQIGVNCEGSFASSLADISSMDIFPSNVTDDESTRERFLICGVGTEVWKHQATLES